MTHNPAVLRLDSVRLSDVIRKQELKLYWLADQMGVDKRTITRWTSGRVKWIKKENLDALAKVLNFPPKDLVLQDEVPDFATPAEHAEAAQAISAQHLVYQLSPIGKFELAETLIKSALQPNLPLKVLADLYLQLCEASWLQNKIDQGFSYSHKAQELALKGNSPEIATQVQLQTGIILSKLSRYSESVEMLDDALANPILEYYPKPKAPLLLNQSVNYMDLGEFDKANAYLQQCDEAYRKTPYPKWLQAAVKANLVTIRIMANRNAEAWDRLLETEALATEAEYLRGLNFLSILRGVLETRRGAVEAGIQSFERGLARIQYGDQGLYQAFGAEIHRVAGNDERMHALVDDGIQTSSNLYKALTLEQLALYHRDRGDMEEARATMNQIKALMTDPMLGKRWEMFCASFGQADF